MVPAGIVACGCWSFGEGALCADARETRRNNAQGRSADKRWRLEKIDIWGPRCRRTALPRQALITLIIRPYSGARGLALQGKFLSRMSADRLEGRKKRGQDARAPA